MSETRSSASAALAALCIILAATLLSTCKLWGSYENPVDPGSAKYQGFATVAKPEDIALASDWDGLYDGSVAPSFSCAKVLGATGYDIGFWDNAAMTGTAAYGPSRVPANVASLADLPATLVSGATYWWRMRAITAAGAGPWTAAKSFTLSLRVAAPTFDPSGGVFNAPPSLIMASATPDASIRYSLDGTDPSSTSGTIYGSPFSIALPSTFKAIAYKPGWRDSAISTAAFTAASMPMKEVAGGSFQMGNSTYANSSPIHTVELSSFYLGTREVTQAQYLAVMGANPSYFTGDLGKPVEKVWWGDMLAFCNALSDKDGLDRVYTIVGSGAGVAVTADWSKDGYRLPTEAEWEYAARGGGWNSGYTYPGSNSATAVAWYQANSSGQTWPAGQKTANKLGLYDMAGNVQETCWDYWDAAYYAASPGRNPRGSETISTSRVARGGSYLDGAASCETGVRSQFMTGGATASSGFRVARSAAVAATQLTISPDTLSLTIGGTGALGYSVLPVSANEGYITWSSSAPSIASVSSAGLVTGHAAGTATITATAARGGTYASCAVTVTAIPAPPAAPTLQTWSGMIAATWTASANATAYQLWYGSSASSASAVQWPSAGTDLTATKSDITGLATGSTFYVWLKAKNAAGTSDFGAPRSIQVAPGPRYFVYVADAGAGIHAYSQDTATGTLSPISGSPFGAGTVNFKLGIDKKSNFLYTVNHTSGSVYGYSINPRTGALTPIAGSPYAVGTQPQSIVVDSVAERLFVGNFTSNTISAFTINSSTGALNQISGSPFPSGGTNPDALAVGLGGSYLYAANYGSNVLATFKIDAATGSLLNPSTVGQSQPLSLAIDPNGKYLFSGRTGGSVGSVTHSRITAYSISAVDGSLTNTSQEYDIAAAYPYGLALDSSGKFLYTCLNYDDKLYAFNVTAATGALTNVAGSPYSTGAGSYPYYLALDPTGNYVYTSNNNSKNISGFRIDQASGALTALGGSPFAISGGSAPVDISAVMLMD